MSCRLSQSTHLESAKSTQWICWMLVQHSPPDNTKIWNLSAMWELVIGYWSLPTPYRQWRFFIEESTCNVCVPSTGCAVRTVTCHHEATKALCHPHRWSLKEFQAPDLLFVLDLQEASYEATGTLCNLPPWRLVRNIAGKAKKSHCSHDWLKTLIMGSSGWHFSENDLCIYRCIYASHRFCNSMAFTAHIFMCCHEATGAT